MTREEAKRVLEIHLEHWQRLTKEKICTEQEGAETISAFNMAIKALEQNEQATEWYKTFVEKFDSCEDCISRKDALANIKNLYPDIPIVNIMGARQKWLEKYAPYFECENAIERLPSVHPKAKTGHWIKKSQYGNDYCSECGYELLMYGKPKFCPDCGAKMESEIKNERPDESF